MPTQRVLGFLLLVPVASCMVPTLTPRAVGCYSVHTDWWVPSATRPPLVLPSVIALDSALTVWEAPARRGWPWNPDFSIDWTNEAGEWMRLPGDTIVLLRDGTFHRMQGDSIVVHFNFWEGFAAYLSPLGHDYVGLAQRRDWRTRRLEGTPIALRRTGCPPGLWRSLEGAT
jgi:hypothetical protein